MAGEVRFENVSFSYADGVPVLKDVPLKQSRGGCGHCRLNGSSKSTLVNLIPASTTLLQAGSPSTDYDIGMLTLASLRRQIGIVMQETFPFLNQHQGEYRPRTARPSPGRSGPQPEQRLPINS